MFMRSTSLYFLFLLFAVLCGPLQAFALDPPDPPSLDGSRQEVESRVRTFDKFMMIHLRRLESRADSLDKENEEAEARELQGKVREYLEILRNSYEQALELHNDSALLHNFYAELLHDHLGQPGDAGKHWRRAIILDPHYGRALNNLGLLYCHEGRYSEGLEHLDSSLNEEPDNPDFLFNLVQIYLIHPEQVMLAKKINRRKLYETAMKMSEAAVRNAPGAFDLLRDYALNFFLADNFDSKPNWKKAAKAWQAARKKARLKADIFNTWLNEARVHIRNRDKSAARKCLTEAEALWPESPVVKTLFQSLEEDY
ncbi:MAG: tetratricopeptide repeat protein [Candidatus Hydrogenedens sp.]|nr:tetratricopeptide repeat protein [Candidatus Hydrogenedens sp.]